MTAWEQRWHPFREEWLLFTSHRGGRPWIGETIPRPAPAAGLPAYDPDCYLCPGNRRLNGTNPRYTGTYFFTNDLPCFSAGAPAAGLDDGLYRSAPAWGTAEVACYHPDHSKQFPDLSPEEAAAVVDLWAERTLALGSLPEVHHVLIFENRGSTVGTSNPHPHCQIYASAMVYGITEREAAAGRRFHSRTGRFLAQAVAEREAASPRLVCENESFLACVPWFARYAYEIHILPKQPAASLADLAPVERGRLARIMREVGIRYDNLWNMAMPWVMAVHQAPFDGQDHATFPFHIEYHPPLRKPDTLKYLAGPEIGGGTMTNESDPDEKAAELRAAPAVLYRQVRGEGRA